MSTPTPLFPVEPITKAVLNKFVTYPVQYPDLKSLADKALAQFWTVSEVDLSKDPADWDKCDYKIKRVLTHALSFFAGADELVNQNINNNFYDEFEIHEAKSFYATQFAIESVHKEMYSLQIVTLIKDVAEQTKMFEAISSFPSIKAKAAFCTKYMQRDKYSLAKRLVCFALVEGLLFSSSFAIIFYLKKRGLFPGVCFSNELISRDEGLHTKFACQLYKNHIVYKLSRDEIKELVEEAVKLEKDFVLDALPEGILGLSANKLQEYIECVANVILDMLGEEKMYNTRNPFDWMELISMDGKSNFFERSVGEYAKADLSSQINFNINIEF
jgi:ribonucleotide reductase beta subunit family protein with ferritin-like domain